MKAFLSSLLKPKKALDALLETMTTDDYDSLGAHRRGESTPESKGTEFDGTLNERGFSPGPVIIPSKDLAQPPDLATAEFFKESDPEMLPVELEKGEHEFFKEAPEFEMSASGMRRLGKDVHSPEWQQIQDALSKFGYRWLGRTTDGSEIWGKESERVTYDPATRRWIHTEHGKQIDRGAVEELENKVEAYNFQRNASASEPWCKGCDKAKKECTCEDCQCPENKHRKNAGKNVADSGEYDFEHEAHVRKEAGEWAQYAEDGDSFDPSGNYLCGTCDMRMGDKLCQRVEGDISFTAGSCRLYHIGEPENEPAMQHPFSKQDAKYAERPHEKGFGCKRCEYGGESKGPDPEGRVHWCSFWGMHVLPDACCAENEGDDDIVFNGAEKESSQKIAASNLTTGGKGVDRNGEYEILSIKGNEITYRYSDGTTHTGDLAIKQRINDGIQAEVSRANAPKKIPGYLQEDEILWTPEMAWFLGYLAGPGQSEGFRRSSSEVRGSRGQ